MMHLAIGHLISLQHASLHNLGTEIFTIRYNAQICINVPNIIKIGETVAELWRFDDFFYKMAASAILDLMGVYCDNPRLLLYRCTKFVEINQ